QNLQTDLITRMRNLSRERSLLLSSMLINPDPFARDEAFMALREKGEAFIRARTELGASELDTEERGVLEAIDLAASRTARHQYRVIDLLHLERFAEATRVLLENVIPAQDRVVAHMDTFVRLQEEQNGRASARAGAQFRDGYLLILVLGSA